MKIMMLMKNEMIEKIRRIESNKKKREDRKLIKSIGVKKDKIVIVEKMKCRKRRKFKSLEIEDRVKELIEYNIEKRRRLSYGKE